MPSSLMWTDCHDLCSPSSSNSRLCGHAGSPRSQELPHEGREGRGAVRLLWKREREVTSTGRKWIKQSLMSAPWCLSDRRRSCPAWSAAMSTAVWGTTTAAGTSWSVCPSDPGCPRSRGTLWRPSKPAMQKWGRPSSHSAKSEPLLEGCYLMGL